MTGSETGGAALPAVLFDGRTAAATPVVVEVSDALRVRTPEGALLHEVPLDALVVSDAFASAPRQVTLAGGAVVEVADGAALTAALAAAGRGPGLVDRLQQRWLAATLSLAAVAAVLAAGYFLALPRVVRAIADHLPEATEERLGAGVLQVLDGGLLRPTALGVAERAEVELRLADFARRGAPGVRYRVVFRTLARGPDLNAFALPGGTLVILDGLVRRTGGDERLVAVAAHELGHLARRHATRALLAAAGVGAAASLVWGDFSGQAAALSAVLAMNRYSRESEREADEDAMRFLRAAGLGAAPMLRAFCLLAAAEREAGAGGIPTLLSTHPDLEERIARVRAQGDLGESGCDDAASPSRADAR